MPFLITHVSGAQEMVSSLDAVDALVSELDGADDEHPDVSVTDDGWCLSLTSAGRLTWGSVDGNGDGERRHRPSVGRAEGISLLRAHASGQRALLEAQPWESGG